MQVTRRRAGVRWRRRDGRRIRGRRRGPRLVWRRVSGRATLLHGARCRGREVMGRLRKHRPGGGRGRGSTVAVADGQRAGHKLASGCAGVGRWDDDLAGGCRETADARSGARRTTAGRRRRRDGGPCASRHGMCRDIRGCRREPVAPEPASRMKRVWFQSDWRSRAGRGRGVVGEPWTGWRRKAAREAPTSGGGPKYAVFRMTDPVVDCVGLALGPAPPGGTN